MHKRTVIIILFLIAGAVAAIFYVQDNRTDSGALRVSGNVEVTEANLGFKMAGRIVALDAEEGARVKKGERIAALDNRELKAIVDQNRAIVGIAEAEEVKAQRDFERFDALSREGAVSLQQLDAARRTRDAARLQVQQTRAALAASEERLLDTVLYAPISAVVLRKNSEIGEMVQAGAAVYTLGDIDRPWVKVYVKENKLGLIKYGQKARVTVDTFPDRIFDGIVSFLSSEAEFTPKNVQTKEERVKLVFAVKVTVENRNGELKPGMPADVDILLQ